jgi:hypothetical protein
MKGAGRNVCERHRSDSLVVVRGINKTVAKSIILIFEGILYARDFETIPAVTNPPGKNLIVFHKLEFNIFPSLGM